MRYFGSNNGKIIVKRLSQILDAEPKATFDESSIQWVANQSPIRSFDTNLSDNELRRFNCRGEPKQALELGLSNLDARRVKNLSTALVTRGTILRTYNPDFYGG
jgi:hypothetical protein